MLNVYVGLIFYQTRDSVINIMIFVHEDIHVHCQIEICEASHTKGGFVVNSLYKYLLNSNMQCNIVAVSFHVSFRCKCFYCTELRLSVLTNGRLLSYLLTDHF